MSKPKDTNRLFDVRAIERNVRQGLITRADIRKHAASLPDVASKGVTLGEVEESEAKRTGEAPRRPVNAPAAVRPSPLPRIAAAPVASALDDDDDFDDDDDDDDDDTSNRNGKSVSDDDDDDDDAADDSDDDDLETN
jgi:hypothetical protein